MLNLLINNNFTMSTFSVFRLYNVDYIIWMPFLHWMLELLTGEKVSWRTFPFIISTRFCNEITGNNLDISSKAFLLEARSILVQNFNLFYEWSFTSIIFIKIPGLLDVRSLLITACAFYNNQKWHTPQTNQLTMFHTACTIVEKI